MRSRDEKCVTSEKEEVKKKTKFFPQCAIIIFGILFIKRAVIHKQFIMMFLRCLTLLNIGF